MKRISISSELIETNNIAVLKVLTPPALTNYQDISARITFERKDVFIDESRIVRTTFNANFNIGGALGVPFGDLDVLELENIEQITAFSFVTNENTKAARAWVEYFHNVR